MRIGIDGFNLAMPAGTGVATYGLALARTLAAGGHRIDGIFGLDVGADPAMREVRFFDLIGRGDVETSLREQRRRRRRILRRAISPLQRHHARPVAWTERVEKATFADRLPDFDRLVSSPDLFAVAHRRFALLGRFLTLHMRNPPDIMHWTYPVPVRLAGARNIYTLHDLVPLKLPYTTLDAKTFYARLVRRCTLEGDRICTVSEASRRDIVQLLGVPEEKVSNCYQTALSPDLLDPPEEDARAVEGVFGLAHRGYFLFFGAIEPKKNIGRLLEAYLSLRTTTPLVIVGARAWSSEGELRLLGKAGQMRGDRGGGVIQLDYLPRSLLVKLIRGARAVVFPSLYEGFGLPVLEAMQLGTPVLTGNTSSLPEVAGDAALLVDPYDVSAITRALGRIDGDADLRDRMGRDGIAQATTFSPDRYLARLEAMYAQVLGRDAS